MASTAVRATHHRKTGLKKAVESEQDYWTLVSASYSPTMFSYPARPETLPEDYTPRTYDLCEYCWHFARSSTFVTSSDTAKGMCVCCAVRFAFRAPVDGGAIPTPETAMALLNASSFARRRVVAPANVDEVDLENPENGRIFGSQYVDRRSGEEVDLDEDGVYRAQCRDCKVMRSVGGGRCRSCYAEWNLALDLAAPREEPVEDLP